MEKNILDLVLKFKSLLSLPMAFSFFFFFGK